MEGDEVEAVEKVCTGGDQLRELKNKRSIKSTFDDCDIDDDDDDLFPAEGEKIKKKNKS